MSRRGRRLFSAAAVFVCRVLPAFLLLAAFPLDPFSVDIAPTVQRPMPSQAMPRLPFDLSPPRDTGGHGVAISFDRLRAPPPV